MLFLNLSESFSHAVIVLSTGFVSGWLFWFRRIHGLSRWWISLLFSMVVLTVVGAVVQFIGMALTRVGVLDLLRDDLRGGAAYLLSSGGEFAGGGAIGAALAIVAREIVQFRLSLLLLARDETILSEKIIGERASILRGLSGLAAPIGLFYFVDQVSRYFRDGETTLWIAAYLLLLPLSCYAALRIILFALEDRRLRLHNVEGFYRLEYFVVALSICLLLTAWLPLLGRLDREESALLPFIILLIGAITSVISAFGLRLIVMCFAWLISGFAQSRDRDDDIK